MSHGGSPSDPSFRQALVPAGGGAVRVVEAGPPDGTPFVFLHGWPESWRAWEQVMRLAAADGARAIALDLPGIGGSASAATDGSGRAVAGVVREALRAVGVERPVIAGHDAGGHVAYAYLREYPDEVRGVALLSIVIPGLEPWDAVLANPRIWHFAFHQIPELPEELVSGKEARYFQFFYDALAKNREALTPELLADHARAYEIDGALSAGFGFYRAFPQDERDNRSAEFTGRLDVPLLYLRGDGEYGDLDAYARGFHAAGLTDVTTATVEHAGHFTPTESPADVWRQLQAFAAVPAR